MIMIMMRCAGQIVHLVLVNDHMDRARWMLTDVKTSQGTEVLSHTRICKDDGPCLA